MRVDPLCPPASFPGAEAGGARLPTPPVTPTLDCTAAALPGVGSAGGSFTFARCGAPFSADVSNNGRVTPVMQARASDHAEPQHHDPVSPPGRTFMDHAHWADHESDPGSTALVATILDGTMFVAHVGDCRLILAELEEVEEGGETRVKVCARRVTADHNSHNPGEAERLARLRVHVTKDGYVGGGLQVSRSIGDFRYSRQSRAQPSRA